MGVTIHYRGRLRTPELIDPLIREVTDIARSMSWECQSFDEVILSGDEELSAQYLNFWRPAGWTSVRLRGLFVTPHPRSESLRFLFDPEGRLIDFLDLKFGEPPFEELSWIFTKTQFAGPEVHVAVVGLLKYLKKKYFDVFEVNDEGTYWKTGNLETLTERMGFLDRKINEFADALENTPRVRGETIGDMVDRIEAVLRGLMEKGPGAPDEEE